MDPRSFLQSRVDPTIQSLLVAVGDLLAIASFVIPGSIRHGYPPMDFPLRTLDTFIPFLIGWILAALLGGLYTADALKNTRRILSWTVPAWILALLIGHALRATPLFHGGTSPTFFIVTLGVGASVGIGWRLIVGIVLPKVSARAS